MIPQNAMDSDEIYMDLCSKIEKLVYLPGDKISENELCRQYGVSRHIIRTVIGPLTMMQLLHTLNTNLTLTLTELVILL